MSHLSDPDRLERIARYVMTGDIRNIDVAEALNDAAQRIRSEQADAKRRRPRWFCVRVTAADPHWGPKINRYPRSDAHRRRLVGFAFYAGRRGISVGKYLP